LNHNFSRRGFLQSAGASLGVTLLDRTTLASDDLEAIFAEIRANLLEMVNEEREVAKLNPLLVDELATQVASTILRVTGEATVANHTTATHSPVEHKPHKRTFPQLITHGP
jgi:uncharacterized protein YkwD